MSDISEANAKIARQEHIKTQQERLEQLEREQEGEQQLKAAYIKNIAELNNDVAELRTKIEQLEQELGQAEVKLEKQEAELRVTRYGAAMKRVAKLQAENERLCEEIEFDKVLDTKIIKDQARKEGRMEAAREIVEFLDVCCMSRSAEMIAERFGLEG